VTRAWAVAGHFAAMLVLLAACAEAPTRPVVETAPTGGGGAPTVSVGGTVRGLYGYTR
jgi:hypothetical protein